MQQLHHGCVAILRRLLNRKIIGGKHLPEEYVLRWLGNLPKDDYRNALNDWEQCKREGIVLIKQKPTRRHISLNPRRLADICALAEQSNSR